MASWSSTGVGVVAALTAACWLGGLAAAGAPSRGSGPLARLQGPLAGVGLRTDALLGSPVSTVPTSTVPTPTLPTVTTRAPDAFEAAVDEALVPLLPLPSIQTNPAPSAFVNLPTWLWINASAWRPVSTVATLPGGNTTTAIATPVRVVWDMGNGETFSCGGPGTPYDSNMDLDQEETDCSYTYDTSSAGQPSPSGDANNSAYVVHATIVWQVRWTAPQTVGSVPLETSAESTLRVEQIESIGSAR